MKFKVGKTSDCGFGDDLSVEINTLEELLDFVKSQNSEWCWDGGESVIVHCNKEGTEFSLEIYDDCRE